LGIMPDDRPERWVVVPTEDGMAIDNTATPSVTLRGDASGLLLHLHRRSSGRVEIIGADDDIACWDSFFRWYGVSADDIS
jgi:hypothetical protein